MKYLKTFIYLFIVTNLSGQTFTNYTTADGLVDNNVSCGTFEGNGVMWFGTQNGISKFDGTNFTNITTTTGLVYARRLCFWICLNKRQISIV